MRFRILPKSSIKQISAQSTSLSFSTQESEFTRGAHGFSQRVTASSCTCRCLHTLQAAAMSLHVRGAFGSKVLMCSLIVLLLAALAFTPAMATRGYGKGRNHKSPPPPARNYNSPPRYGLKFPPPVENKSPPPPVYRSSPPPPASKSPPPPRVYRSSPPVYKSPPPPRVYRSSPPPPVIKSPPPPRVYRSSPPPVIKSPPPPRAYKSSPPPVYKSPPPPAYVKKSPPPPARVY